MSALPRPVRRKQTLLAKHERVREIIDHYALGVPFADSHLREIADLTDTELRSLYRAKNPQFPNDARHLHALAYDWLEPQQWSWRTAVQIAHARSPEDARAARERQKVLLALRFAIQPDLNDFRAAMEPQECAVCGSVDDLTTDHVKPPFSVIAAEFMKTRPVIELREVQGHSGLIASSDIEADWIAYHASRAIYQLLCRRCNSHKGAR